MILEIMLFIFSRWQLANMMNYQKHKILYADAVGRNVKLVYPKQRYCNFSIFQMAAAAIFYF